MNYAVITIAPTHPLVSLTTSVERDVQMSGMMEADGFDDTMGSQAIG